MKIQFEMPPANDQRILVALGNHLNLKNRSDGKPRAATELEYQAWLIFVTDYMTLNTEKTTAAELAKAQVPPLTPIVP